MNIEEIRLFCLSLKGVTESFPFNETVLVFKVMNKMFCLTDLEGDSSLVLKNSLEKNSELREMYPDIIGAFHMNKKHWNSLSFNGAIPQKEIKKLIVESYDIVVLGLTKKKQEELKNL